MVYKNKFIVINPLLRKKIYQEKENVENIIKKPFTILIIGGSQGAEFFDNEVSELMIDLFKDYKISLIQQITDERKKQIISVGTSTIRALETVCVAGFQITTKKGWTDKFVYPPYDFKMCDSIITNFHQPQSTLMMLVAAFAKKDFALKAYKEAIKKKYRFYSYGDAMIII